MNARTPDDQAADWLIRRDRGLTPAEQDDYLQWLAADPRHGDALARQQETWRELDLLADWRPEHAREPNPALLAPPRRTARRLSRPLRWFAPVGLAAAACVALAFYLNRETRSSSLIVSTAPAVATGYERRVLDDGSVLELNRGASVSVVYTATERRVRLLSGEAHFTVAKNPARPFVVSAAVVETRAVGTAFNVRLGSAAVEVLVTEGKVAVSEIVGPALVAAPSRNARDSRDGVPASGSPTFVAARERITIPLAPASSAPSSATAAASGLAPVVVSADEMARALAWQPRLLEFSAAPLAEVVADFNRHNTVQLALADPALATLPVTASFRSDNAEGFVRLLEATAGVRAERRGETISLRRAISP
ncbi:MAG: hypothetical protein RLZZ15_2506 [Verrucomicrobiota bacterium]|jgi:transmembrane sensor